MTATLFADQRSVRRALEGLDLEDMLKRLIQDAVGVALPAQWQRRAEVFEHARPRPGDYFGQATEADLEALDRRNALTAAQCRLHAALLRGDDLLSDELAADVSLVCGVNA